MFSFSTPYSWPPWGIRLSPRSFSRISVAPSISPRNGHTKGGAVETYLERGCVHACTLLYTREYTMVYTRVHFSLLGSRYMLGTYSFSIEVFLSLEWRS